MLKKCQVVMLPTEKASLISKHSNQEYLSFSKDNGLEFYYKGGNSLPQHIYILSDEEIKEGDWCIMLDSFDNVFSSAQQYINPETQYLNKGLRKIIASTDSSLEYIIENVDGLGNDLHQPLPQPSESFIQVFIEEYNKGNVIKEVMIEYEYQSNNGEWKSVLLPSEWEIDTKSRLKINPKDNTITIRKVKDSWNKEEVSKLIFMAYNLRTEDKHVRSTDSLNKWIEENL